MQDRVWRTEGHQGGEEAGTLWVGQRWANENVVQVARQLGCSPEELLDFASNVNPLGTPPALRQLWRPAEAWRLLRAVQRYPDPECRLLRQAIAEAKAIEGEGVITARRNCGDGSPKRLRPWGWSGC